jgi:hypothetical protein
MGQTLEQIAQMLDDIDKKVQLIYAFNGTGKTRLSRAMKDLVAPDVGDGEQAEPARQKILYYNAFTEDLFYWDNDLQGDGQPKLMIQPNSFTHWILADQGQEVNITRNFQRYTSDKLTPAFNEAYNRQNGDGSETAVKAFSEVTFSIQAGGNNETGNFKISKGEESNFIWSIFYTLLEEVISVLSIPELADRPTDQFNQLRYVFIDDPVSSLDENHLIELAVNLAAMIKSAPLELKFIITTHNPFFYNVLHNELNSKTCYLLERLDDGTFSLVAKQGDSNQSFSYHLHLMQTIELAHKEDRIQKYHFTLLRNLYEKSASFLGYPKWSELLPEDKQTYLNRVMQFASHSSLPNEVVADPTPQEKRTVKFLLDHLRVNYGFWQQDEQNV